MFKKRTLDGKVNFVVRILFVLAFLETVVFAVFTNDYSNIINAFTALLGFALTFVPEAVENISKRRLRFSSGVKIAIVLFISQQSFLAKSTAFMKRFPGGTICSTPFPEQYWH